MQEDIPKFSVWVAMQGSDVEAIWFPAFEWGSWQQPVKHTVGTKSDLIENSAGTTS